jgi:hypothetical protein
MSSTITIPASGLPIAANTGPVTTAYPKALRRAKEFLKIMLRHEVDYFTLNKSQANPLISKLGPTAAVAEFRTQLDAYASKQCQL